MPSMMRLKSTYQRETKLKPGDVIVSFNGTNLILDKGIYINNHKQEIDKQSQERAVELAAEKTEAATKTQQQHPQYHHQQQQVVIQQNYQQEKQQQQAALARQHQEEQRELEEQEKLHERKKLQEQTDALERLHGENGTKKKEPPSSSDSGRIKSTSDLFYSRTSAMERSSTDNTDALSKRHKDLLKAIISHQTEFYKFHRGKKNEAGKIARSVRDKLKKDDLQKEKEADQEERASTAAAANTTKSTLTARLMSSNTAPIPSPAPKEEEDQCGATEIVAGQQPPPPHQMVAQPYVVKQPPPPPQSSSSSSVASNPPPPTTHHHIHHHQQQQQQQPSHNKAPPPPVQEHAGRWTAEEHRLFLQGLEQHGKGWKKIASLIKSRTAVQIRTHAQKYFQKLAKARQNGEQVGGVMDGSGAGGGNGNHGQVTMATRAEGTPTSSYPQVTMRTISHHAGNGGNMSIGSDPTSLAAAACHVGIADCALGGRKRLAALRANDMSAYTSLLEDTQQRAVELAAEKKKIIPVATASDVIKISHRDVSKLPVVFGFHLDDKGSRSLATAAATEWRNGGKKAAKSVYIAKISLQHHNSSSNTSDPRGSANSIWEGMPLDSVQDEKTSSSNGDEELTTIHATDAASQGDGNTESDMETNETGHYTIAMETKIRELQSTIAQQQVELAQKDEEIANVMMERSQTTRKMSELQSAIAQQQTELAQKDGDIAQRDKDIAIVMMERSQTTRQLAEQQSTIAQLRGDLAQKHEDLRSMRIWRLNGLDAESEVILESYTKCCVCLERYDEGANSSGSQRLPIKSATCSHSLCEECLNDYHASLMNGKSTLRYVRCPQCNDKSKRAFDIKNKVVDSFLREYIQCRKGKRKYHTTLQSESEMEKGQLKKQAQQMVEVEEEATEAHMEEAHREESQQQKKQMKDQQLHLQPQHKQFVQIDGNERSKRERLASSNLLNTRFIGTKKQRESGTDEVAKAEQSLHPEVKIGDMKCQMHYDDGNSIYVGPLDGLPLLTSLLQKESRYLHPSQKLLLAQLEIFKISPKLMKEANSESLGLRCQNCVTEKNGCCFMKLSSSNNLVRDLFLFGKEHVVRCVTKAKVKKQIHDALLLLGRSADELSNYCTLIANLYGLEDKKSADGRINVVLGQSPTIPAGYSFPIDIDVRGILRASSAEANQMKQDVLPTVTPAVEPASHEHLNKLQPEQQQQRPPQPLPVAKAVNQVTPVKESDEDGAAKEDLRNQEKHWMAMWKDAKDELKKLRDEMRNEPDDEVRAELARDTEELNAWIEYHK